MTSAASSVRYHHLDALRAFAMLLGIVLHGLLSFVDLPIWPAQDIHRHSGAYGFIQHAIHGFRMPLFFLVSGFFTCMLWRRRGLRELVFHRLRRVLVPLLVGTVVLAPVMAGIAAWGGSVKARIARENGTAGVGDAARHGDLEAIRRLAAAGVDLDSPDAIGVTPLAWAAMAGQTEAVALLLELGADPERRNGDGSSPLHSAAFLGRPDAARLLIEHGARVDAVSSDGSKPIDSARAPWPLVQGIAGLLGLEPDEETVKAGQRATIELLESRAVATSSDHSGGSDGVDPRPASRLGAITGVLYALAMIPVFHHLWFLHYLCWLVALFAVGVLVRRWRGSRPIPARFVTGRARWLWLIPLPLAAQWFMLQSFGPDTASGLVPWPPILLYYAVFFAFGALCFGRPEFEASAGRHWRRSFLTAAVVLVVGVYFFERRDAAFVRNHAISSTCAVAYAWLMIFGCIGLFHRVFARESPRIRYWSDASYWLYLAHLPCIIALQIAVSDWSWPSLPKFLLVVGATTAGLMVVYRYAVRYTFVGTMLNGRKSLADDRARIAAAEASRRPAVSA